jgi:hypothetical protein
VQRLIEHQECVLYHVKPFAQVARFIATTPDTRAICNDPFVFGTTYTSRLQRAMMQLLQALRIADQEVGEERNAVVLHILRGGLNFGLREALASAYGWERHRSAFISSQRANGQKGWYITEDSYEKVMLVPRTDWIIADVVATGVSLKRALLKLIRMSRENEKSIRRITFFTIGGSRAEQLVAEADAQCRKAFPDDYQGASVVYLEGIFGVAEEGSPLQIRISGTDLLRHPAELAPEFVVSQGKSLSYALERCTIYDAGSRAFDIDEYLHDVSNYWARVLAIASKGTTYEAYLRERFPTDPRLEKKEIPPEWKTSALLADIATQQIIRAH